MDDHIHENPSPRRTERDKQRWQQYVMANWQFDPANFPTRHIGTNPSRCPRNISIPMQESSIKDPRASAPRDCTYQIPPQSLSQVPTPRISDCPPAAPALPLREQWLTTWNIMDDGGGTPTLPDAESLGSLPTSKTPTSSAGQWQPYSLGPNTSSRSTRNQCPPSDDPAPHGGR